jgi:hypothetical protein
MHVVSQRRLERVTSFLSAQEQTGKSVVLVVEPYVDKLFDFSTHIAITADGHITVVDLRGMRNRGFAFEASCGLTDTESAMLDFMNHSEPVQAVGRALLNECYWGPVCIDGLVAAHRNLIVPVLEINARLSMGAISSTLDSRYRAFGLKSFLTAIRVSVDAPVDFDSILERMSDADLLLDGRASGGIVVLTARTLPFAGQMERDDGGPRSGRLFINFVHRFPEEIRAALLKTRSILKSVGYYIWDTHHL